MTMFHSKAEAVAVLEDARQFFVDYGRWLAVQICNGEDLADTTFRTPETFHALRTHPGMVHAKLVRDEMAARGLFDGYEGSHAWAGAVFREPAFRPRFDEKEYVYSEDLRNIHNKRLFWWSIDDHEAAGAYAEPIEPEGYVHARKRFREDPTAASYGASQHRLMALEIEMGQIRQHALAHKKERETIRGGGKIEAAPMPYLSPSHIDWILNHTALVAHPNE